MKETIKLAFAAFALLAFTACGGSETNTATESETTEQSGTEMETDMGSETDTTSVQDTTVNDGVADEIPEEQPPQ